MVELAALFSMPLLSAAPIGRCLDEEEAARIVDSDRDGNEWRWGRARDGDLGWRTGMEGVEV